MRFAPDGAEGWRVAGPAEVTQVCVGYDGVWLRLWWDAETTGEVRVEQPCLLSGPGVDETRITPGDPGSAVALVALVGARIEVIGMTAAGVLTVELADRRRIIVSPHDAYEAWQVLGEGWLIICLPGGGLAEFVP
jgi:hypothetical protein